MNTDDEGYVSQEENQDRREGLLATDGFDPDWENHATAYATEEGQQDPLTQTDTTAFEETCVSPPQSEGSDQPSESYLQNPKRTKRDRWTNTELITFGMAFAILRNWGDVVK
jgi:hypothetical protein